jgi:hypothetical protein
MVMIPGGMHLKDFTQLKFLYSMFCIIIRYHQQDPMIQLLQKINKNLSIHHLMKVLSEEVAPILVACHNQEYHELRNLFPNLLSNYLIGPIRDDEINLLKNKIKLNRSQRTKLESGN